MNRISTQTPAASPDHLAPHKVALFYGLAGAAWILLTDELLRFASPDINRLSHLQTVKGWVFVLVSTLLLYALLRYYLHAMQRREALLRASEERFRSVFMTGAAGMVLLRPDGRFLQANPAFCRFIGYSEEELTRMTIAEVTHPEDRKRTEESYEMLSAGQESIHYEKRYLTRDGRTVWGHASVACLLGRDNLPGYCIGLVQDISDRNESREKLEAANRELEAFVYTVSHDLRSALTPIIGYADFLRESCQGRLSEEELDYLSYIRISGEKMVKLMEDLLDLARVGQIERPSEPLDTGEIVNEVVRGLTGQNNHGEAVVDIGTLPALRVPRTLLMQIFDNLISNALRYGCQAGGRIEVGGERNGARVRLYVRDHGPGIPPEERERIFEIFCRGSIGNEIKGTGIGLATVQKIAKLYTGRAWVEETPGGGSTFWVEMVDEPMGKELCSGADSTPGSTCSPVANNKT